MGGRTTTLPAPPTPAGAGPPDPRLIVGIHDNKVPREGKFNNDDRGKLIRYLGIVLEHYQQERKEIGGSLFDGQYAQCFRLERGRGRCWKLHCSKVMNCAFEDDAKLSAGFMSSKQAHGWYIGAVPSFCGKLLGAGSIGAVFAHKDYDKAVVKVPRVSGSLWFKKERSNLQCLATEGVDARGRVRISDRDTNDDGYLILEPPLQPMSWPIRLHADLSRVADLVEGPITNIHDKGWVHGDLRPDNIMEDLQKRLVLVDFGAARRADELLRYEHGTLTFASAKVRSKFSAREALNITASDDLESLVYVAYAMMAMSETEVRDLCTLKSDLAQLGRFWDERFAPLYKWEQLRLAARSGDHALVARGLRELNQVLPRVPEEKV